ncbi:recombinase family protein [Microvirga sp. BT325]|uniref:Recombinase family protein n=1 Tax=Microvirga splendida TaxID=2795727 RepID=A0ABS0Y604_9HYPH|nr:recombinase family protein [Microvirga splendida]
MRTGIYARVSTQRQAQADSLAQRVDRLQAHALGQGWSVAPEHVFRDDGYSGLNSHGPVWSGYGTARRCANSIGF